MLIDILIMMIDMLIMMIEMLIMLILVMATIMRMIVNGDACLFDFVLATPSTINIMTMLTQV